MEFISHSLGVYTMAFDLIYLNFFVPKGCHVFMLFDSHLLELLILLFLSLFALQYLRFLRFFLTYNFFMQCSLCLDDKLFIDLIPLHILSWKNQMISTLKIDLIIFSRFDLTLQLLLSDLWIIGLPPTLFNSIITTDLCLVEELMLQFQIIQPQ